MWARADADAPPGFEDVAPGTHDVASIAAGLSSVQVRAWLTSRGLCLRS